MTNLTPTSTPSPPNQVASDIDKLGIVGAEESEDQIEEYLADFLKRHNIGDGPDAVVDTPANTPGAAPSPNSEVSTDLGAATSSKDEGRDVKADSRGAGSTATSSPGPASDLKEQPRRSTSLARESAADLNALRQLANTNARSAIGSHQSRQIEGSSFRTFLVAALTSLFSIMLVVLSSNVMSLAFGCAAVMLVVSWVATWRYFGQIRRLSGLNQDSQ